MRTVEANKHLTVLTAPHFVIFILFLQHSFNIVTTLRERYIFPTFGAQSIYNMKRLIFLFTLFLSLIGLNAQTYTIQTVPNPKNIDHGYVSNPDGILSMQTVHKLNQELYALEKKSEVQTAIVAIQSIGQTDYTEFAYQLASYWGIGKADKSTGLLLLLVLDQRAVRIEVGNGLEGLLPDAICERILQDYIFPAFKAGDYDSGFLAATQYISQRLTLESALEELLLKREYAPQRTGLNLLLAYLILAFLVLLVMDIVAYKLFNGRKKSPNNIQYQRVVPYIRICQITACMFPLPMYFWYIYIKRQHQKLRQRPIKCPECGAIMQLLNEQEEDRLLSASQQTEEKIHSIDYDVWECKSCLNHIILPYESMNTKYQTCPYCHTHSYGLYSDVVRVQATQFHPGKREKTYLCKYCGKTDIRTFTIPQLPIVVTGGGGRGSFGGGGGFSGGSWGGGGFSGGGAGGNF